MTQGGAAVLADHIRTVPDFPSAGIQFRDITPLLAHPAALKEAVAALAASLAGARAQLIAGMEARGFIFGAAVAVELGIGFLPLRKPGKLPVPSIGTDYALEYGTARLELDPTLVAEGARIALVDDLIATGGTALAAARLVREAGGQCVAARFVIDLPDLGGAELLRADAIPTSALLSYPGH